jgi:hypothetical protein
MSACPPAGTQYCSKHFAIVFACTASVSPANTPVTA